MPRLTRATGGGGGPAGQGQWSAERLVFAPKVEAVRTLHVLNELVKENGTPLSGWKCAIVFDIDFLERGSDRHAADMLCCATDRRLTCCAVRQLGPGLAPCVRALHLRGRCEGLAARHTSVMSRAKPEAQDWPTGVASRLAAWRSASEPPPARCSS